MKSTLRSGRRQERPFLFGGDGAGINSAHIDEAAVRSAYRRWAPVYDHTFGRFTTEEEIDYAAQKVCEAVTKLRALSPLWDMYKDGVDISKIEWAAH